MNPLYKKDKGETKLKLIKATGEIFMSKGYHGLNASRIADKAGVSKTLIYRYFGNVQELFKAYLIYKDYWVSLEDSVDESLEANLYDSGKQLAKNTLKDQIDYFLRNKEMQQIIRWQITEPNDISRSIADAREQIGEKMFEIIDPYFENSDVNFRALMAVSVAGIYFLTLNAKISGSTFCGIDFNKEQDVNKVQKALGQLVDLAYEKAKS